MKKGFYFLFVLTLISISSFAQSEERSIIEELNSSKWGQGNVKVLQDEAINGLLGIRQETDTTKKFGHVDPNAEFVRVKGFKIQVFSGNNQQRSKREAESKQAQVRSAFPELETVVSFHSPFWRLRVGNFLKSDEAEAVLKEMKKTFPSFGREMYVVPDVVKRPVE
ncbi:SPOR domain-containing protein [Dysgonomonas sp. BGC7]|uniref:SPOR domain-containing protein n=1 Tax=Dysgonomonas sp. BGC7 TaxID=1658008 RepID=UPI000681EC27|nr:SPOR domain-containing protein [Dysgonomonas sp. BGC7]MBD8387044.1 SPOR domain-containing protein [Dysgonomonas sp. BGC7]